MSLLHYKMLYGDLIPPMAPKISEPVKRGFRFLEGRREVTNLTLVEDYCPELIKVHRLSKYRRRSTSLLLLPNVKILIDAYKEPLKELGKNPLRGGA